MLEALERLVDSCPPQSQSQCMEMNGFTKQMLRRVLGREERKSVWKESTVLAQG